MASERTASGVPVASVVITTKNRSAFVAEAIESVLALDTSSFEVDLVVIDDGSTDDTPSVLARYPIRSIRTEGVGMAGARSLGLEAAVGEFVTFLDDDDVLLPNAIGAQLAVFARHPEYAVVHAQAQLTDQDLRPVFDPFPVGPLQSGHILPQLLTYFPQVGTIVTRVEAAREAGRFDPSLPGDNDWDWLLRIARRHPVGTTEQAVMLFRMRAELDEDLAWRRFPAIAQIFKRHTADLPLLTRIRLRPTLWRHRGWCAGVFLNHVERHLEHGDRRRAAKSAGYGLRTSPVHFVVHAAKRIVRRRKQASGQRASETATDPSNEVMIVSSASNIGGMERIAASLTRGLQSLGTSVRFFAPAGADDSQFEAWCRRQGVRVELSHDVTDAAEPHSLARARELARLVDEVGPRVVNLHYGDNFVSLWDVLGVRLARGRVRTVVSIHGARPWSETSARKRAMSALAYCFVDHITTVSSATADVVRRTPARRRRVSHIASGVAVPSTQPEVESARRGLDIALDRFVIACVARLDEEKDIPALIDAADVAELAGAVLLVAGEGPARGELERLAKATKYVDVRLLGALDDVGSVLAACDVLALASRFEGFGLVFIEAAMHGRPSIGTRVGGVPDAVIHGETGLLVEPGDVGGLREALIALATDTQLRQRLGDAARVRAIEEFSETSMASRFHRLFGSL